MRSFFRQLAYIAFVWLPFLVSTIINLRTIMSKISDYGVKQTAHNDAMEAGLTEIAADITTQNELIKKLQESAGEISTEDQAILDQLEATGARLEQRVKDTAKLSPPEPPTE